MPPSYTRLRKGWNASCEGTYPTRHHALLYSIEEKGNAALHKSQENHPLDERVRPTSMSHRALRTFSSNVGSTIWIDSPAVEEIVSLRSKPILFLHVGGAEFFTADSKLERGGGEADFDGVGGTWENSELGEPLCELCSLPEVAELRGGRE